MKAEREKANGRTRGIDIHVPMDVLRHPEDLPLTLRNIVVLLARLIPRDERETFNEYMRVVSALERMFDSLCDD